MADQELSYKNLNAAVLESFPFLTDEACRDIYGYTEGRLGPYVLFGDIFNRYVRQYADLSTDEKQRVGAFLERMAESPDGKVEDLLTVEVLPVFLENQAINDAYWQYLGQRTRQLLTAVRFKVRSNVKLPG
ncbi:MAG: hypothetical protein AB1898_31575 [Acidobacteriota bacterium]